MKFIIFGLGNPGSEYENNRHNTGRIIIKNIASLFDCEDFEVDKNINADKTSVKMPKNSISFILPNTFMNKSGDVLKKMKLEKKDSKNIIVVYDDLDLPFGKMKFSFNKSSGGHKGLESIIKSIKTEEFYRIRVGISKTTQAGKIKKPKGPEDVISYVMKNFNEDELKELKKISKKIKEGIEVFTKEGYEKTATFLNS